MAAGKQQFKLWPIFAKFFAGIGIAQKISSQEEDRLKNVVLAPLVRPHEEFPTSLLA